MSNRTRIKICGITNVEDAQAAVEYGADALGFILVPDTPRFVTVEMAYNIGLTVPPFVTKTAVFQDWADWLTLMPKYFDAFQYYTNEKNLRPKAGPPGYSHRRQIRAFRMRDEASLAEIATTLEFHRPFALLLDTYHKDKLGGAGETFNWDLAAEAKRRFGLPIILAGGLTPENVGEAVRKVRPYAVDVSSGVEASPGKKNHVKIKAFMEAVRAAGAES